MSILQTDCPRCNSQQTTFDCWSYIFQTKDNFYKSYYYELFYQCRVCHLSSIFLGICSYKTFSLDFTEQHILDANTSLNDVFHVFEPVLLKGKNSILPPKHLPSIVEERFKEGCDCLAIQCFNASVAMFRLCLQFTVDDLISRHENVPNKIIKNNLYNKIEWLFEQNTIRNQLRELSDCIRLVGNDGVHDGGLTKDDAQLIQKFTYFLLEDVYSVSGDIEKVKAWRKNRNL